MPCQRLCLSALTLFLLATPVWADVSVEVPGGANILGSLVPAGDVDTFTFEAVAGIASPCTPTWSRSRAGTWT